MSFDHVIFDEVDGIASITLNRPDVFNAMNLGMVEEMTKIVDELRDKGTVRVLLLNAAGRGFCGGGDLATDKFDPKDVDAGEVLESHFNPLIERIFALPFPVVVAVNGPAVGAGCSLALTGDIVIAARSAYFKLAFARIGLVPDCGLTWLLPRLVGRARAAAMMLLGESITAEQAQDWGMIYQAVDDDLLEIAAREVAERLSQGPTKSFALIRHGLRACLDTTLTEGLHVERINQRAAGETADFAEGVSAFLAKRMPSFVGK